MKNTYQYEIESFREKFSFARDKKIVLYGIGRYTATVLSALKNEFCFVGLMDRNDSNIGKIIDGVKIISREQAEENADLIIINTQKTYWNIIYKRISDIGIPVFFKNGERAKLKDEFNNEDDQYWNNSYEELYERTKQYDVISFDLFDTLIMRKVLLPKDVFFLLEKWAHKNGILGAIYKERSNIGSCFPDGIYTYDDIYIKLQTILDLTEKERESLQKKELELEEELSLPRIGMVDFFNKISEEKECYILTDMYLPKEFLLALMKKAGMKNVKLEMIWESCEKKCSKKQGQLWNDYRFYIGEKRAFHIGDNLISDVENAKKVGIEAFYVYSSMKIWEKSSLASLLPKITEREAFFGGMINSQFFSDPFGLNLSKGKVVIQKPEELGKFLFGPLVYTFLDWIIEKQKEKEHSRVFFFARDGYWLEQDYNYLKLLYAGYEENKGDTNDVFYLPISRRVVLVSSINESEGLEKLMSFSFIGTFSYYMKIRLNIELPREDIHYDTQIIMPKDYDTILQWIRPYKEQVMEQLKYEKDEYLSYLDKLEITENDYVVDLWFNGNNQFYLSKTLSRHITGLYLCANLSENNPCKNNNTLCPCIQDEEDPLAKHNYIRQQASFVESVLTAPYGMIMSVNKMGECVYSDMMENQKHWESRTTINKGIMNYMEQAVKYNEKPLNAKLVNEIWKVFFDEGSEMSEHLQDEFYYDNVFVKEQETHIFQ